MEKRISACPLDCPDTCGIIAHVDGDRIVKFEGDPNHPFTRGFLCEKMRHYPERIHSTERILYPMKRKGKKGDGNFERISWDTAWNILTSQLSDIKKQFGGEALLPYSYAGNMGNVHRNAGHPFFYRYGASRLLRTICSSAGSAAMTLHMGAQSGSRPEIAKESTLIVVWGCNVKVTNSHFMPIINHARRNGAKLVVIDPYRNLTAKSADSYFAVKPSGDAALALGILKALLEKKRENKTYIQEHTEGFDQLSDWVQSQAWDLFEHDSGLTVSEIGEIADLMADNPRTFIRAGFGLTRNTRGAMSIRAILALSAALGLIENAEGKGVLIASKAFQTHSEKFEYAELATSPTREINMVQLGSALTKAEPQIKGLFIYNSNPVIVAPNSRKVREGLSREDLFTIVHEQWMTSTAKYADLLLPATTAFENEDIFTSYGHPYLMRVLPVISPRGESISNFELFRNLAQKMGYTDAPLQQTVNERIHDFLKNTEGIPEAYSEEIPAALPIKTNLSVHQKEKFQFAVATKDKSIASLPGFGTASEFEDKEQKKSFPLCLITPPARNMLNSTFGERYKTEIGTILIHPDDARTRNIEANQKVKIFNQRGHTYRYATITPDTQPGLVVAEGLYWPNEASKYTTINDLTSESTTDLGQGSTFHESRVEITHE